MIDGSIPRKELLEWIDHSYIQVVNSLKKADRDRINESLNHQLFL